MLCLFNKPFLNEMCNNFSNLDLSISFSLRSTSIKLFINFNLSVLFNFDQDLLSELFVFVSTTSNKSRIESSELNFVGLDVSSIGCSKTSRRSGITKALAEVLGKIDGRGLYKQSVAETSTRLKFWDEVEEFPAIHLNAGSETRVFQTGCY